MRDYLKLFKQRDFGLLVTADAVSVLGDQVGWVALLWFATVTTKNPGTVGLLGLAYGLPGVLLGAVVGSIFDRISHKTVLLISNILLGTVFMCILLFYNLHELPNALLLSLVLIAGCLTPFTSIGWMVVIPNLVIEEELGLANSIVETIWHGASLLGPIVGGILIIKFGSSLAVLLDGISFLVAAFCVLLFKTKSKQASIEPSTSEPFHISSFWRDTWNGFKTLYGLKPVWWITIGALFFNLAYGQLEVSLPLFTNEMSKSAFALGTFWTTYFVASLFGAAISGILSRHGRNGIWMSLMAVTWGVSFLPMIWIHSIWMTYISMALGGLLFSGYPPLARTSVQRLVPKEYQGRIMGIRGSLIAIGMPVGSYLSGTFGDWIPSSEVIGYTGLIAILVGMLLLSIRTFRTV